MLAVVPFHHGCRMFLGVSDFFFCYSVCCRRFGHFSSGCPTTLSAFRTFLSAIALLQALRSLFVRLPDDTVGVSGHLFQPQRLLQALRSLFVRLSDGIVGFVIYRHFYAQHPPRLRFNDLETQIGKIKFIAGAGIPPSFSSAKPPTVL